jgi:uncharacterized protein DUF6894
MTKYFFDIKSDDVYSLDEEGQELLDAETAHDEAVRALADTLRDVVLQGGPARGREGARRPRVGPRSDCGVGIEDSDKAVVCQRQDAPIRI